MGIIEGGQDGKNVVIVSEVKVEGLIHGKSNIGTIQGSILRCDIGRVKGRVGNPVEEFLNPANSLSSAVGAHESIVA